MISTTPQTAPSSTRRSNSASRSRNPPSRPTTPLRPSSRSSLRESSQRAAGPYTTSSPLESLEPAFAELSDSMADLEANFMHLQLMHESLARFSESFAGFLYGMNMNAFCVDFPEAPVPESFKRAQQQASLNESFGLSRSQGPHDNDPETTFLTTDTSFIDNPPSSKTVSKFSTPAPPSRISRRGIPVRGGRGTRGSGLARATGRGRGRGAVR